MGLDMFFTKRKREQEEVGYLRKANQVHKWIVDNIQHGYDNCGEYEIEKHEVQELLNLIRIVLKDKSKAEELLPTEEGFFFGDTEYEDWYFDNLIRTEEILENILDETDFDNEIIIYQSSW